MQIDLDDTNYKLCTIGQAKCDQIDCIVIDSQLVLRVSAWYFGPSNAAPPKRLPVEDRAALVAIAQLNERSLKRRGRRLTFEYWLACVETSRRRGRFDAQRFAEREVAMTAVLSPPWIDRVNRMSRVTGRARTFQRRPQPFDSLPDGAQLYENLLSGLLEAYELRDAITRGHEKRTDAGRLDVLDQFVSIAMRRPEGPTWGVIPLAMDGIMNPQGTSYVAEAIVKPSDQRWRTPDGTLAMASNTSFDLLMADMMRSATHGRSLAGINIRNRPRIAALLTQDRALIRLVSLIEPLSVLETGTLDSFETSKVLPRASVDTRRAVGSIIHAATMQNLLRKSPPSFDVLEGVKRHVVALTNRGNPNLDDLFEVAEARFAYDL